MAKNRNIFIAFWQLRPEKGEDRPREAIEEFGAPWAKIAPGIYYLHCDYDAEYVGNKIWAALNMDDKMVVLDTTNNDARWFNVKPDVSQFLIDNWHTE